MYFIHALVINLELLLDTLDVYFIQLDEWYNQSSNALILKYYGFCFWYLGSAQNVPKSLPPYFPIEDIENKCFWGCKLLWLSKLGD